MPAPNAFRYVDFTLLENGVYQQWGALPVQTPPTLAPDRTHLVRTVTEEQVERTGGRLRGTYDARHRIFRPAEPVEHVT